MINLSIVGQMIAFAIFVLFCMKFVWPPLIGAITERQRKIEEGLDAAKQARSDLALVETKVQEQVATAKNEAVLIIEQANKTAHQMIEDAKEQARLEGERIVTAARGAMEQEIIKTKETLRSELATLVVLGAEKILQDKVDEQKHAGMLEQLASRL